MNHIYEIYLTKKYVLKDEWLELIKIISNYNGLMHKWKIIITNNKNEIRYYIKTKCSLPATINNLNSFLLKPTDDIKKPSTSYTLFHLPKIGSNIIDLINYNSIKNKGNLIYLEMNFRKIYPDKITTTITYFVDKDNISKKYFVIYALPVCLLSVDFEGNKRYFFKEAPKYLDISKILHLLNTDTNNALLNIDTFPYLQGNFYLKQNSFSFDKHSIIIGSSGCGKSKFISYLINNINKNPDLRNNYKVIVIDPHAALNKDIGGIGKTIDFTFDSIDLFLNDNADPVAETELLIDLFKTLFASDYNSKLERVLRHSIHILLTSNSFNFRNLRKLLLDLEYRNTLLRTYKDNLPVSVIDFFLSDFNDLKTKSYTEAISPIIGFIDEMEMIPIFNSTEEFASLESTIKENFLTLFSLDRTKLGDKVTKTISGLIMQQLLTIIMNQNISEHIIFIIDEVAVVENPILKRFLSESRKYNLSLILAGQYFSQITEDLKNAIFANVINYFIFRVSKLDANVLVDNFNMKVPLEDTRERKIKILTELNNRECIVRIDTMGILLPAFKAKTMDFKSIPGTKKEPKFIKMPDKSTIKIPDKEFKIDANIGLKDILIKSSTSRKVVK